MCKSRLPVSDCAFDRRLPHVLLFHGNCAIGFRPGEHPSSLCYARTISGVARVEASLRLKVRAAGKVRTEDAKESDVEDIRSISYLNCRERMRQGWFVDLYPDSRIYCLLFNVSTRTNPDVLPDRLSSLFFPTVLTLFSIKTLPFPELSLFIDFRLWNWLLSSCSCSCPICLPRLTFCLMKIRSILKRKCFSALPAPLFFRFKSSFFSPFVQCLSDCFLGENFAQFSTFEQWIFGCS